MYTYTQASQGHLGPRGVISPAQLRFAQTIVDSKHVYGLVANANHQAVLRGNLMGTSGEALESFIDTVLGTSQTFIAELEKEMKEEVAEERGK